MLRIKPARSGGRSGSRLGGNGCMPLPVDVIFRSARMNQHGIGTVQIEIEGEVVATYTDQINVPEKKKTKLQ